MEYNDDRGELLSNVKKIVVKIGTTTLTKKDGNLDTVKIDKIVQELSNLMDKNYQVVLVTSGAVGAGMGMLKLKERPNTLAEKQAVSSVGQVELIQLYQKLFLKHNKNIGQLLLTKGDFSNRNRYINARNVCNALLRKNIIPIINENDSVVANEIKVGDNDTLSALVAGLVDADLLIILSDIDGLYDKNPNKHKDAQLLSKVEKINDKIRKMAEGEDSKFGTGGMITKIRAAEMSTKIGTNMIIANGKDPKNINRIVNKENIGTLFLKSSVRMKSKKYWLAYGTNKNGQIIIDKGAKMALKDGGSLLPVGIKNIEGYFPEGAVIQISDEDGNNLAKGISNYSSKDILKIMGHKSDDIESILGYKYDNAIVHVDNLILM